MEFNNHKIIEAVCSFNFDGNQEPNWNVGKFADFFKLIESDGFVHSQEQNPTQINITFNPETGQSMQEQVIGDLRMIYTDKDKKYAIIMSKALLSIHSIGHYQGWEVFEPKIKKYAQYFFDLGLGKILIHTNVLYINRFEIKVNEHLASYLKHVPDMSDFKEGTELNHAFQSDFLVDTHTKIYLNTVCQTIESRKNVTLQCGCLTSMGRDISSSNWQKTLENSHFNAVKAFKTITQEKFKTLIS